MNTETKQPAAGEYWEWDDNCERVRIIANDDGDLIYRTRTCGIRVWLKSSKESFVDLFRHLPDCDSFYWKETVYPRYAVPVDENNQSWVGFSYAELESKDSAFFISNAGDRTECVWKKYFYQYESHLRFVSREEAEARHARLHREWVQSQLVVIDREKWPEHVPRVGVDWKQNHQLKTLDVFERAPNGKECCLKQYNDYIQFLCLPKDLPVEPPAAASPGRSFRILEVRVAVGSARFCIYQIPISVDGQVTADLILNDNTDPAKVVSRTVHLVNEEEF